MKHPVKPTLTLTVTASAAITGGRFVSPTGGTPSAGGNTLGVACTDAANGSDFAVDALGTAIVIAGGAIAAGAAVKAAATGKALTHDSTNAVVARALTAAAADGDEIKVMLIPN